VGAKSPNASLVTLRTSPLSRLTMKMSPVAPVRPENATSLPSGLMSGDSGMSTVFSSIRRSTLPLTTFCMISVFIFSVRAK
jgi:hypothetical protein